MATLRDLERDGIEVIAIREYSRSVAERERQRYREAVRLDNIEDVGARDRVVGRVVKYARRITLIDPYIASSAESGHADAYVRAVAYVAELGSDSLPMWWRGASMWSSLQQVGRPARPVAS